MTFIVTSTTLVSTQTVADTLCAAFEGGSNYWLDRVEPVFENSDAYTTPEAYGPEMTARLIYADEDDTGYMFNVASAATGLNTMAGKYPDHFHNLIDDNGDAETGDVLLQCILFGEIVYG